MDKKWNARGVLFSYLTGKKARRSLLLVAFAFIFLNIVSVLPFHGAAQAVGPTLTIKPVSATYSSKKSVSVQGKGYRSSEAVQIYWNYLGPGTGTFETTATTSIKGTFSTSFYLPLTSTGNYTIAAIGQTSGLVVTGTFTLLPHIYGGPLDAGAGTPIHFNGYAFGAGETVNLYWNYTGPGTGSFLTRVTGNSTGSFLVYTTIPGGTHTGFITVAGVGQTTNAVATTQIFVYPPTVALAPLSGSDGTTLSISAYGFTAYENASIYWNNATTPFATVRTNTYGYVPITPFSVPAGLAPGAYPVTIVGATSKLTFTNSFTIVSASSSASVTSGPVGQSVQVSGQGYAPGENVVLIWNYSGPGTGTNVASVKAGLSGAFNAAFTVPAASTGSYSIAAVGVASAILTSEHLYHHERAGRDCGYRVTWRYNHCQWDRFSAW